MNGTGFRYHGFLAIKTALILIAVPLGWMEAAPVIRALRPDSEGWRVLAAVLSRLGFIGVYAYALGWSFADQRRRCPVCLKRLAMPVAMGSWASVFEPAKTELVCADGHGSLEVHEAQPDAGDEWIRMDGSWQDLFEHETASKRSI